MRISHAVIIRRPPSDVWPWIGDPEAARRWQPEVAEYEITTASPGILGTEFREQLRDGDGSVEMRGRVVEYEPRRLISFDLRGRGIRIIARYALRARGAGTELDVDLDVSVLGPLTRLLGPFLRPRLMRQLSVELERLRIMCESEALEVSSPRDSTRPLREWAGVAGIALPR
jgi:carbon monoxide dehydrogenase subunit G